MSERIEPNPLDQVILTTNLTTTGVGSLRPDEWGAAVAKIAADHLGKEAFDFVADRSHGRTAAFIRHVTWAHLRFGGLLPLSFPEIARIANRDHTTIMSGLVSLSRKIEHLPRYSKAFDTICANVKSRWPNTRDIRPRLIQLSKWR